MISQKYKIFFFIALGLMQKEIVIAEHLTETTTVTKEATTVPAGTKTVPAETNTVSAETTSTPESTTVTADFNVSTTERNKLTDVVENITDLDEFHYVIFDNKTEVPCVLSKMGINLTIPYKTENGMIATTTLEVPFNASVTGTCKEDISIMTLAWQQTDDITDTISDGENMITMKMKKDGDIFYVQDFFVSISLDNINFPNATESKITGNSSTDLKLFPAPLQTGMHVCEKKQEVIADPITMELHDVSLIAFNNEKNLSQKKAEHCTKYENIKNNDKTKVIAASVCGALICILILICIIHYSTRKRNSWNLGSKARVHKGL